MLRREGLHKEQLTQWRKSAMGALSLEISRQTLGSPLGSPEVAGGPKCRSG